MTRPGLLVRFAGSPVGALCVFFGCFCIVVGWDGGGVPWWVGVAALLAMLRTFGAIGTMRRYKRWMKQWDAMGTPVRGPEKKRKDWKVKREPEPEPSVA